MSNIKKVSGVANTSISKINDIYLNFPDSYTKLLLHCDGTDGSTTFTDECGKTVTAGGNAQIDTAQKKFGTGSGLFDGSGDYLSIPDSDDWNFGTANFTIDFWVRFATLKASFFWHQNGPLTNTAYEIYYVPSNIRFDCYSAGTVVGSKICLWSPEVNTWYHVAFVRRGNSGNGKLFINGVSQSLVGDNTDLTTLPNATNPVSIGAQLGDSFYDFDGWLEEFRVSKGIARWWDNFTPPTTPYSIGIKKIVGVAN